MSGLFDASRLPKTRLELRWVCLEPERKGVIGYNWRCDYELVLELEPLDIRGERYNEESGELVARVREKRLALGGTSCGRNSHPVDEARGDIDIPFRDGAHIGWDSLRLGLPAYVVCGDRAMGLAASAMPLAFDDEPSDTEGGPR